MSQITCALVLVLGRVDVQEQRHHLRAAGAELDRLARLALRDPPELGVVQRAVLDLVDHVRPAPAGVDLVEQRAGRIVQPRRGGLFGLQVVAFEARPALQRIVVPGAAGQIFIDVEVAVVRMSRPARSWSLITTASASWNFSRKRTSSMQVSSGRPHMLTSNQRGRGNDPVVVLGRIRSAVAVNMDSSVWANIPGRAVEQASRSVGFQIIL